ncbi:putative cysteine peptidase [Mycoplasmopsis lipofaciens]|uniref:putative cysteine peptidase n=1 Tax=Mycoplasmopsis lipofaciens TaxID=114884 RepID=UPI000480CE85|nr:hypothetical protein [Mycoplasmopsis lipofaciens]
MNKKILFSSLTLVAPLSTLGAYNVNTNYGENDDINKYFSNDFKLDDLVKSIEVEVSNIKKTNLKNSKIISYKKIINYDNEPIIIFKFINKGYAVVSLSDYELIEYNPNVKISEKDFQEINKYYPYKSLTKEYDSKSYSIVDNFKTKIAKSKVKSNFDKRSDISLTKFKNKNFRKQLAKNYKHNKYSYRSIDNSDFLNADYEIDYSWWFKSNFDFFGYTDLTRPNKYERSAVGEEGLCEYISLAMLIQYHYLFKNSKIIEDRVFNKYAKIVSANNWSEINNDARFNFNTNKYQNYMFLKNNNLPLYPIFSSQLVYDMYKATDVINIINPKHYTTAFNSIVKNDNFVPKWYHTYFANRPWKSLYDNKPVILGGWVSSYTKDVESAWHSVIAYGKWKDGSKEISNLYLTHYGWGHYNNLYSQVAISAQRIRRWGYMWYVNDKTKENEKTHDKVFWKDGKYVSALEIDKKIFL